MYAVEDLSIFDILNFIALRCTLFCLKRSVEEVEV